MAEADGRMLTNVELARKTDVEPALMSKSS